MSVSNRKGGGMGEEVKRRLYVSVVIVVVVFLYVGPFVFQWHAQSVRTEFLQQCYLGSGSPNNFEYCWQESKSKAALSPWKVLFPFLPAGTLVWLNWLLNPHLRLPIESFPKRTVRGFLWFGIFGALLAIALPIVSASTLGLGDIGARELLGPLWFLGPLLLAPLLFHYLMAPIPSGLSL
jgi:hypothetical protein